jgi:predicted type IV restriction endonuclease
MPVDIRKPLKKLLPHLIKGQEDNLNEADTVQRIIKMFEEVLGYDPMTEITRETQVKDKYVDVAIKLDGTTRLLIEAKAAGVILRDRHIEQAQHYAAQGNMPWVILTNSVAWNLYHLSFEEGIEYIRAFSVDLSVDSVDQAAELLGLFHRHAMKKGELEQYWERHVALSPTSMGRALFTEACLRLIRREIRRREGVLIDEEDLAKAIHGMLSIEAREQIGPPRVRRRAKAKLRATTVVQPGPKPPAAAARD